MNNITKNLLFSINPETAHDIFNTVFSCISYVPQVLNHFSDKNFIDNKALKQNIFKRDFLNPVGLAAGFDKNASMIKAMSAFGFGHLELGSVTRVPQKGNAKPRLFRFENELSLQNAMGFNNDGAFKIASRVEDIYPYALPIGMNLGKNKNVDNANCIKDYAFLVGMFSNIVDYFVINISSPNTKNLRELQNKEFVKELLQAITPLSTKPILIKIAPDLSDKDAIELCSYAVENKASGIIATNTTNDYSLIKNAKNFGGISGQALREKSREKFKAISKELFGQCTLISVGGISDGKEAYERILYGASLVQIYTSIVYEGMSVVKNINEEILQLLKRDGFENITEAIGSKLK